MRIRLINPNTTDSMTATIAAAARLVASSATEIAASTSKSGAASIEGHYDEAMSIIGLIEAIKADPGADAYVIACFGDPGLLAAREIARGPVVGIAEAAMHAASLIGNGFTIVSMLERTRATMEHLVHAYGMSHKCRNIRMTDLPVLELEEEGSNAQAIIIEECRRALEEDHSDAVLLGCGGMSDLMALITREIGAPAIDGVSSGVKLVEALVSLGLGTSKRQAYAYPVEKAYTGSFSQFSVPAAKV